MRLGADRHDVGLEVARAIFPEGARIPCGVVLGSSLGDLPTPPTWVPGGGGAAADLPVSDPPGNGRALSVKVGLQLGKVGTVGVTFTSRDRMDVDAVWPHLRDTLTALYGASGKEVTGVLTFVWSVTGSPAKVRVSRFKNDAGLAVLSVTVG